MSISCPNKRLKIWKDLVQNVGENKAYVLWAEYDGNVPDNYYENNKLPENIVKTGLKATDILMSEKAIQIFEKGKKANWDLNKILTELQVPKEQKQLLLDLNISDREQIALELASKYSYTIEVNTAKENIKTYGINNETGISDGESFTVNGIKYSYDPYSTREEQYSEGNRYIDKEDYEEAKLKRDDNKIPTQYYSNLTVPGGTNYTENEIATPAITPSIKGHAEFATDNGIGWFRSDEQAETVLENYYVEYIEALNKYIVKSNLNGKISTVPGTYNTEEDAQNQLNNLSKPSQIRKINEDVINSDGKTRRILEVQSDLFQKGRDKEDLVNNELKNLLKLKENNYLDEHLYNNEQDYGEHGVITDYFRGNELVTEEDYLKTLNNRKEHTDNEIKRLGSLKELESKNQFLQLLNKNSNWVTFFVKSIIQDSAKKGYEKVLFPSGNTASKVEGHTTLEEFKKQKEDRIKELEEQNKDRELYDEQGNKFEELDFLKKERIENNTKEINQLKQELERVEGPGGFGALKPIYNFYENTVTNILKKQGYNSNLITDEYGNTWNEVTVDNKRDESTIFMKKIDVKKTLLKGVNYLDDIRKEARKDYSSEHSRILFNNKQGKITVDEILDNILNNFNDLSPEGKTLLEKSRRLVGRTGAKFQFVSDAQMKQTNTLMQIEGDTNVIQISRNRIKNIKPKEVVESFIHELVHAQTLQALINPQTYEERDFKEFVTKYYRIFKAKSNFSDSYGFDKVEEFVAEIYANPDFRAELQKLDSVEKTNLWTDLINHIRRLFGLAKSKKVNDLIESVIDYVEADRRDHQGLLSQKSLVFEKRLVTEDTYHSLDDKFNNLNKKALENIEEVLKRTIRANEKKSTDIRVKHITESKELLESIKKYQTTEKWKAILAYTKSFGGAINFINSKLDDVIQNRNLYEDDLVPVMTGYKDYLASYDLLKDVEGLLNTARLEQDTFTEEEQLEYRNLKSFFENALAEKNKIDGKFEAIYHKQGLKFYSNPMYNTEIETMYRDELRKEYNSLTDSQKDNRSEVEYISEMINTRDKDDFSEDIKAKARNLMTAPSKDIDASSVLLDDSLNIKSKTVQIINNILGEAFDIVKTAVLTKVHQMDKQYKEFIKGRGNKPSEINKNLIEKTEDGQHYLRGKYSIKYKESFDKMAPIFEAKKELIKTKLEEGLTDLKIKNLKEYKDLNKQITAWYRQNTVKDGTKTIPHPKFLNKAISDIEQKQLDSYIKIWEENDKIDGFSSLVNRTVGAKFYQLASITKSDLERRIEADVKGLFKDKLNDLTKVMPDDIGIDTEKKNANIVRKTKTHYRGPIESHIQSLDLETMARNEYWNGQNYQSKHVLEHKLNVFAEIVKSKDYYDVKGNTYKGEFSQEYKKILGIIERNVYDIQSHTSDMNKVSNKINGYAASLAMSFNLASGTANLMNGMTQLFIEKFGNDKIKKGTLGKAEIKYTKAVLDGSLLKDTTNSVKQHYFNQLLEKFDVMGGLGQNEQEAIRNSLLSKFGSTKMMNFLNEGGEHMMHCVITEAILDSIKVMNKDNKYIDKDGKVTTKDNAASLVDMLYMDSNNQLQMSDKVVFTSQNLKVEYHEGGNVHINMLIKKKVFDLFGVYDAKFKNELSKTWYGKSVMMFKNFFMGGLSNRFTGFKTARRDKSLLEDDDKFYNSAEKEYIEGTYITLTRFFTNEVIPNLKNLSLIWQSYDNLSDYEKANLRKATMEIVISTVVIPSVGLLLASLEGDGGDDEALWFAIYLNARLGQELRQFWNPLDAGKMINNPIAGSRFVNNALSFGYDVISPLNISPKEGDSYFDYLKEDKQSNNVMIKHFNQLIPITSQFKEIDGFMGKNYQQLYGLQYGSK